MWLGLALAKKPSASSRRQSSGKVGVLSITASLSLQALPGLSYRNLDLPALHWVLLRLGCALTLPILVMHLLLI